MLSQVKPPFRAEHIGSLLRPTALLQQRAKFARGEIDAATLGKAEDQAIKDALVLQERIGFKFATDGEFRRRSYHSYFYARRHQDRYGRRPGSRRWQARPTRRPAGGADQQPAALERADQCPGFPVHQV
jgi:methionine synthase II (cobalamin-independent)